MLDEAATPRSRTAASSDHGHRHRRNIWDCVLQVALVLWIVRVPVATTAFGFLILDYTPQAQDLFVEFARTSSFWIVYFVMILIAVWAMPTHYAARLLLDTDERLSTLLAAENKARGESQTADTRRPARCLNRSAICVPRLLGMLTFAAVLIAIMRSHLNLPQLDEAEVIAAVDRALIETALLVLLGAAAFLFYVVKRSLLADLLIGPRIKSLSRKQSRLWRRISPGMAAADPDEEASRDFGRLVLLAIFVIFVAILVWGADFAALFFPRALGVPFILGGWLPILSYLSGLGRQYRAPLIAIAFVLVSGLGVLLGDNHSVRRIHAASTIGTAVDISPIPLDAAVRMWMHENGCDGGGASCPRPIIIAAQGGASRAAFFTASIVGYFLQEAPEHGLTANQIRNRLFAISSVSGSSVGAVMLTAALAAKDDSSDHPCIEKPVALWWGQSVNNWRDCFEALTSGDFLTADFFGFSFNDMFPFGWWRDRAAVLEDSWRNRYRDVVTRRDKPARPGVCDDLNCPFLALRPRPGHWIPLLVLNGTSEATGWRIVTTSLDASYTPAAACPIAGVNPGSKCPLFVQGDRFHDLLNEAVKPDGWFGWLGAVQRYLLRRAGGDDIRLSTAAHNSARFPLISPPGTVRNNKDQAIVDRLVDGGYFENYGASGAKELALALHAAQPRLAPLVIVISNDPNDVLDPSDDAPAPNAELRAQAQLQAQKARTAVSAAEWVTDIEAPLTTFANTRTAHGILNVAELHNALHAAISGCDELLIQIRVWPQNGRDLSMSWWESTPIQRQLHRQTEPGKDANKNESRLQAIWNLMKTTSACAGGIR